MKRMPSLLSVAFALCVVAFSIHFFSIHVPAANAQPTDDILRRIKETYRDDVLIRAEFSQRLTAPDGEMLPGASGTILFQGDRYRVEADEQTFVTDGSTTWIYNAYDDQVIVNDYIDDAATFSLTDFLFAFDEHYTVTSVSDHYLNGVRHRLLAMEPRADDSFFREVTLWMRDTDTVITRLRVVDVNEAELDFTLENMTFDPPVTNDPFTFAPPETAEIIDLRS